MTNHHIVLHLTFSLDCQNEGSSTFASAKRCQKMPKDAKRHRQPPRHSSEKHSSICSICQFPKSNCFQYLPVRHMESHGSRWGKYTQHGCATPCTKLDLVAGQTSSLWGDANCMPSEERSHNRCVMCQFDPQGFVEFVK